MSWSRRFRVRQFLRGSIWFVPVLGGAAGSLCGIAAAEADRHYSLPEGWSYSAGTAQAVLASVVGASVGLTGFVVTVAVLIVQMATGTFSARYMRIFYRDGLLKAVLAVLVGTLTFSYALLRRVEQNSVPSLGVTLAGFLLSTGVLLFLVFLNRSIHRLRPVAVAALVAKAGRRSFDAMIREAKGPDAPTHLPGAYVGDAPPTLVVATLRAGAVQAMDARGLARFARAHDCLIVVRPAVGDFVPEGAALLEVYGGEGLDAVGGEATAVDGRARGRADDRAGPRFRDSRDGRHRDQGALARRQRPDHCRAGPRPSRRHAAALRGDVGIDLRPRGRPITRSRGQGTTLGGHRRRLRSRRSACTGARRSRS